MTVNCSNCGKPITDNDKCIRVHGLGETGSGILIGRKDFVIVNPDFCSVECVTEYFSDALSVVNEKCDACSDPFTSRKPSCDNPKCPYIKYFKERKRAQEMWDRVVKRDGGVTKHIFKTCKKFYFEK